MWQILFVALLPCLWAAEIKGIQCPDGTECPLGKTCHEVSNGYFQCTDLPDEDQSNKKLVPGSPSSPILNVSHAPNDDPQQAVCRGTWCSYFHCCENFTNAKCCTYHCCASNSRCCSSDGLEWCCLRSQRCHRKFGYCRGGANALSPITAILVLMFVLISSKYFF